MRDVNVTRFPRPIHPNRIVISTEGGALAAAVERPPQLSLCLFQPPFFFAVASSFSQPKSLDTPDKIKLGQNLQRDPVWLPFCSWYIPPKTEPNPCISHFYAKQGRGRGTTDERNIQPPRTRQNIHHLCLNRHNQIYFPPSFPCHSELREEPPHYSRSPINRPKRRGAPSIPALHRDGWDANICPPSPLSVLSSLVRHSAFWFVIPQRSGGICFFFCLCLHAVSAESPPIPPPHSPMVYTTKNRPNPCISHSYAKQGEGW